MAAVIPNANVPYAPDISCIREVSANDVLPTERKYGINCADFDELMVILTPVGATATGSIEPHFWSDSKDGIPANGGFVAEAVAQTLSITAGSSEMKIMRVAHSKSVWFHVSGLSGAPTTVRIEVSGIPIYGKTGGC